MTDNEIKEYNKHRNDSMNTILCYSFLFIAFIAVVWWFLGRGSALFCFFVGMVSFIAVFIEFWMGSLAAFLISGGLIILIPITLTIRKLYKRKDGL